MKLQAAFDAPHRVVDLRVGLRVGGHRDTSLIRKSGRLGPYSRTMPRALWQS